MPWPERSFDFGFPADLFPELLERLRGTPARVEDHLARISRLIDRFGESGIDLDSFAPCVEDVRRPRPDARSVLWDLCHANRPRGEERE